MFKKAFFNTPKRKHIFELSTEIINGITVIIKCKTCGRELIVLRNSDNDYSKYNESSECGRLDQYIKY